jgi:hypothetical protein
VLATLAPLAKAGTIFRPVLRSTMRPGAWPHFCCAQSSSIGIDHFGFLRKGSAFMGAKQEAPTAIVSTSNRPF